MRLVFFGTSDFSVPILEALISNFEVAAVVTQPDRPSGRNHALQAPPVKQWLMMHDAQSTVQVLQPEKLDANCKLQIANLKPDVIVLAAYGKIIPQSFLEIPPHGFINVHPSLLPRWRGASPIQNTILSGDQQFTASSGTPPTAVAGVTIIKMDEQVDHGPIIAYSILHIAYSKITYKELEKELSELGAKLIVEALPKYVAGEIKPMPQDHSKATFCKLLKKEDGHVDWHKSALEIERMVRAYDPWPGTFTSYQLQVPMAAPSRILDKVGTTSYKLKILKARILHETIGCAGDARPGALWATEQGELAVNSTPGSLVLLEVQPAGKKEMSGKDFLAGHREVIGKVLE
jgi:methionyl-tRNA formyltransferase